MITSNFTCFILLFNVATRKLKPTYMSHTYGFKCISVGLDNRATHIY